MTQDQIEDLLKSIKQIASGLNYYAGKPEDEPVGLESIAIALGYREEAIPRIANAFERIANALETLTSK